MQIEPPSPFFIVGCPRSGTTLLQIMLDSHRDIAIPPESHIFERFMPVLGEYGNLSEKKNALRLLSDIMNDIPIRSWGLNHTADELFRRLDGFTLREIVSLPFRVYCEDAGKKVWGDKTPQHMFYIDEIRQIFPAAKFIFLLRDGRDVAESLKRVHIGPQSIAGIARRWRKYAEEMDRQTAVLPAGRYIVVQYEKLVENPRQVQSEVFAFLGVGQMQENGEPSLLNPDSRALYLSRTSLHNSLSGAVSASKVGVFKRILTERQVEIFEHIAGAALVKHGYVNISQAPAACSKGENLLFLFQDHVLKYMRKLQSREALQLGILQLRYGLQAGLRKIRRKFIK